MKLISSMPFLVVKNVAESASFYRDALGFFVLGYNYRNERPVHCQIERDSVLISLHEADPDAIIVPNASIALEVVEDGQIIHIVDLIVFVSDVTALYHEIAHKGAKVVKKPNEEYMAKLIVEDLDGHRLCFVQHP